MLTRCLRMHPYLVTIIIQTKYAFNVKPIKKTIYSAWDSKEPNYPFRLIEKAADYKRRELWKFTHRIAWTTVCETYNQHQGQRWKCRIP